MFGTTRSRGGWRASSNQGRGRPHSSQSRTSRPCRYFQKGSCRYGSDCNFSHDEPVAGAESASLDGSSDVTNDGYNDWKCLIRTRPFGRTPADSLMLREIWSGALHILNDNNRECHQRLIRDLVDDKFAGCEYILQTLGVTFSTLAELELDFIDKFLRTITHDAILHCLSVDTYVGTLYNLISGPNGERAVPFFLNMSQAMLTALDNQPKAADLDKYFRNSDLMADTLHQLLIREKRVSFNEQLPKLLNELDLLYSIFGGATGPSGRADRLQKDRVEVLRRIVSLNTGLLEVSGEDNRHLPHMPSIGSSSATSLLFPVDMHAPGDRHDNDHADIALISIIPTASELASDRSDYLPSTDYRQPHFLADPVQRHIDTHFRLLRHDIFGSLRQAVLPLLQSSEAYSSPSNHPSRDANAHFYRGAFISHVSVHEKRGFEVCLVFRLPPQLRAKTAEDRRHWWKTSKRLEPGNLACLVHPERGEVMSLLLIVVEKHSEYQDRKEWRPDISTVSITARLASFRGADLHQSISVYRKRIEGTLVGFPSLLPATFAPILENMQKMIRAPELPFREWVIPDLAHNLRNGRSGPIVCPRLPQYARQPGFLFSLESIVTGSNKSLSIDPEASPEDPELLDQFQAETSLDRGQCSALIAALTREFALIQGPPGTGKSYLGVKLLQVLLSCRQRAALGPIIVICYTNHALDQFLSHLLHVGIDKIIRIGGQSRAAELDGFNLRTVCERAPKTGTENYILGSTYAELEKSRQASGKRLATLHKLRKDSPEEVLKRFLQIRHPQIYCQLYSASADGWRVVRSRLDPLLSWTGLPGWSDQEEEQSTNLEQTTFDALCARAENDVESLSLSERKALVSYWIHKLQTEQVERLLVDIEDAERLREQVDQVHSEVRRRTLLMADIIGITTTGLAKEISVIRNLQSKVVVAEEAAEVHEAHILSALMPGVEHFIQIGDHQQLRPQISNYSLSLESSSGKMFQLDRSQFERLAVGEPGLSPIPVAQLDVQRRMRPEIARLIRNTMYPGLRDHESVVDFPDVSGMRDNVFWLTHSHEEDSGNDHHHVKSHSNEWEVDMTKALIRHLVRQGCYNSTDIAVLTPCSGQLVKLRNSVGNDFDISLSDRDEESLAREGFETQQDTKSVSPSPTLQKKRLSDSLRLATVDNFQGEEAKVVIVSLVRSNHVGKVGFLKTKNRINVLLSRAQHGMYLIGNADTYGNVPMWVEVRNQLEQTGSVGPAFRLCCPRHRDTPIECTEPEDFPRLSPEGGCALACGWRLEKCGHQCLAKCHSEAMHSVFLCPRPCPRRRVTCDHPCPKLCGEDCGPCEVVVDNVQLPCGHSQHGLACFWTQQLTDIQCNVEISKEVPGCGHVLNLPCHRDTTSSLFKCPEPCLAILECGHSCSGSCGKCSRRNADGIKTTIHQTCYKQCGRPRNTCSHVCIERCHVGQPCSPCRKPCEVRCSHSRCALFCRDVCTPCIEQCAWSCEHQGSCTMPCAAPCNRLPCDERCPKTLSCGHQCPGLCGEHCPQGYCQACGEKADHRVDLLEFKSYKDIDLNESPIVVLGCGHFFTAESLDGLARLGEVYTVDSNGEYVGFTDPTVDVPVPNCPDCKTPIRQFATQRYNRVVNAGVMDETTKRFLVKGQREIQSLEECIREAQRALRTPSETKRPLSREPASLSMVERIQKMRLMHQYEELERLEIRAVKLRRAMDSEQQPCKKLFDAILEAKVRESSSLHITGVSMDSLPKVAPERRLIFAAFLAELRIRAIMLQNKTAWHKKASVVLTSGTQLLKDSQTLLHECEELIEQSSEHKLPRYTVICALTYADMAWTLQYSPLLQSQHEKGCIDTSKALLEKSKTLCKTPFDGAAELAEQVDAAQQRFVSEWYEDVTADEMKSIKLAMISGSGGISTHSGHWYKCQNGHAFAIGECGMPVEEACCPECGSRIGGQNHQLLPTVTRAEEMEI